MRINIIAECHNVLLFQDSVGIELWSMSDDILFDNIMITDNIQDAQQFAAETFDLKIMKLEKGQVSLWFYLYFALKCALDAE